MPDTTENAQIVEETKKMSVLIERLNWKKRMKRKMKLFIGDCMMSSFLSCKERKVIYAKQHLVPFSRGTCLNETKLI